MWIGVIAGREGEIEVVQWKGEGPMADRDASIENANGVPCRAVSVVFDGAFGQVVFRDPGAEDVDVARAAAIAGALAEEMRSRGGPIRGHVALNLGAEGPVFRTVIDKVLQATIDGERLRFSQVEDDG